MTDQIATNPDQEVVEIPAEQPVESLDEGLPVEPEPAPVEDDTEEVEREGQKYRIPKALKNELLMHADYTRKTQAIADERKALEAERSQIRQVNEELLNSRAEVIALDKTLAQYAQVDWNALSTSDPVKAQQLWIDFSQLKDNRQKAVEKYGQAEHQLNLKQQQEFAKRAEETKAVLQRDIKDWTPETAQKHVEFARTLGFNDQQIQIAMATDPASVKLLNMAYQFDQMLKKATKPPVAPIVEPKPVQKVTGPAKVTKSPADMSDKEFSEWRRRQIAQRR